MDAPAPSPLVDNFALLNEPRRPWLDTDLLKEKFLTLSAQAHPDRVHQSSEKERAGAGQRYSTLNSAYNCLREPKERLRHLLQLEQGSKPADIQRVPAELMDWHFDVGQLCQRADVLLAEIQRNTSPMLKVKFFERAQEQIETLSAMQQKINSFREGLLAEIKTFNSAWETADASGARSDLPLTRLEEIYRLLGYLARWSEQVRERIVELSI